MPSLVPFAPAHFAILSAWFESQAAVTQWGGPKPIFPLTADQFRAMLDEGAGSPPARLCWMAENPEGPVGHAQLAFDWRNGNALLGRVAIAPAARGKGLAVPMLRLVVEKAFAFEEIERVELNVYDFNRAAIRSYERLGFTLEGVRRSSVRVGDERWNTAMMGLLRSEWAGDPREGSHPSQD